MWRYLIICLLCGCILFFGIKSFNSGNKVTKMSFITVETDRVVVDVHLKNTKFMDIKMWLVNRMVEFVINQEAPK